MKITKKQLDAILDQFEKVSKREEETDKVMSKIGDCFFIIGYEEVFFNTMRACLWEKIANEIAYYFYEWGEVECKDWKKFLVKFPYRMELYEYLNHIGMIEK